MACVLCARIACCWLFLVILVILVILIVVIIAAVIVQQYQSNRMCGGERSLLMDVALFDSTYVDENYVLLCTRGKLCRCA